ncbi:MAG: transcription termination/antitermination protein NusA [Proteobacteria bacterium]|nr:transcription termination/antitermination protein NusA [Pseudomonadota bacterium]
MNLDLNKVIEQVGKDKGIDKEHIVEALEAAMLTASRKKYGIKKDIEAQFNPEMGEVELFQFKTVVEDVEDEDNEMTLAEGRVLDPDAELGDSLGFKLPSSDFGRIAAQVAKQVIIQRVRDAERDMIYNEYKDRKGELLSGFVRRFEKGNLIVDLGKAEAVLPYKEQMPRESYRMGDRIRCLVIDVKSETKGPQIFLSRSNSQFMVKLFTMEVPEIYEGIVEVKGAAREPGVRSKIAVQSNDSQVDPVGACVGMKGSRVQSVVQELRGEKIDIVAWNEDIATYVCNALSPAEILRVIVDEGERSIEVVVPDDQLSLAIGKRGQNVRLAAMLVGWKIDITTESTADKVSLDDQLEEELAAARANEATGDAAEIDVSASTPDAGGAEDIEVLKGVGGKTAGALKEAGITTVDQLASKTLEEMVALPGIGAKKAETLLKVAKEHLG